MDNVRFNISPCSSAEVNEFVRKIDNKVFTPNGMVCATERSHYDRYSFLVGENRIAVVYDTSACILSITGRSDHAQALLDLFGHAEKSVKRSTVPAQGATPTPRADTVRQVTGDGTRAKLFVSPDRIRRRTEFAPVPTLLVSSKGAEISTDEIYPPQTIKKREQAAPVAEQLPTGDVIYPPQIAKKRPLPSYGENNLFGAQPKITFNQTPPSTGFSQSPVRTESATEKAPDSNARPAGIAINVGNRVSGGAPRRAVISFGTDDDGKGGDVSLKINTRTQSQPSQPTQQQPASVVQPTVKRKRGRPPKSAVQATVSQPAQPTEKRKRGRPPKNPKPQEATADIVAAPEYKNGYSVKNFPLDALSNALKRLKSYGKTVAVGDTEFAGTIQEVKNYTVTDAEGQRVLLRYATKRMTLQLQGKRSNLFGEVMSQVSNYSDYSSALENYVEESGGGKKVSDIQNKLKKRLPTAYEFLSEQSRIDFSYGIHDFSQQSLHLSDYSVLLVPAFRGLERFVFDLQCAEGIKVKMIGQAFDKDDSGKYILKSGYTQRIGSVVYAEVLVALYSEYFAQRNFFAHSDNTESNMSRSIPERGAAQKIFEHLLDVVEYNAKKLKEIGFSIK